MFTVKKLPVEINNRVLHVRDRITVLYLEIVKEVSVNKLYCLHTVDIFKLVYIYTEVQHELDI